MRSSVCYAGEDQGISSSATRRIRLSRKPVGRGNYWSAFLRRASAQTRKSRTASAHQPASLPARLLSQHRAKMGHNACAEALWGIAPFQRAYQAPAAPDRRALDELAS